MERKLDPGFQTYAAKIANVGVLMIIKNFGELLLVSDKDLDAKNFHEYSINGIKTMLEGKRNFCQAIKFGKFVWTARDSQ